MVRRGAIVLFLLSVACSVSGQMLEFTDLIKLPTTVNSAGEESTPLLSANGSRLYFVRSFYHGNIGGNFGGQDIWVSDLSKGTWKVATNRLENVNTKGNNVLIGMNRDGRTIYILNTSPSEKLTGIYFAKLKGQNEYAEPEFVPIPGIENEDFVGMFVSADYDVVFISMKGGDSRGEEDIYISTKDRSGAWSRPRNMGPTINSSGFEISPFLSADKKRLYFASNGLGGVGDADIFYSERLYNSWETWSAPVNLGPVVNSKKFDAYFSIYGDSIAYFTSNRDQQLSDIYLVKVSEKIGILPAGQRFLTEAEWNTSIGKNVNRKLTFEEKSPTLTAAQRELLYYIANKASALKDVGFHLIIRQEEDPELSKARMKAIYGELRQHGIDSNRIREEHGYNVKSGDTGMIELMLYKEEGK
jgi:hypothetical protein